MTEAERYFEDVHEPENESIVTMDEIKTRVKRLADEARAANEHSYKEYLSRFAQLIENYVVNTNDQNVRGAIFLYACEYDYHMPGEIDALPDNLPPSLAQAQDCPDIDDMNEDEERGPSLG